ncbi:MAG: hypothetical protein IJJ99_03040 [Oscillospiraceae bacterium]|nr:hypothetical protein [Oscillospiraceae bacterium]
MSIKAELIALAEKVSGESNLSAADIAAAIALLAAKMPEAPGTATTTTAGLVKQGVAVPDAAGETVTGTEFNALLASLRGGGSVATAAAST